MSYQPPTTKAPIIPDAKQILLNFLEKHNICFTNVKTDKFIDILKSVYDKLDEALLRELVKDAIEYRENLTDTQDALGPWAEIIDAVREITVFSRQRASENLHRLVQLARLDDLAVIKSYIFQLELKGELDSHISEIVNEASGKFEMEGQDEHAAMFRYFSECIGKAKEKAASLFQAPPHALQPPLLHDEKAGITRPEKESLSSSGPELNDKKDKKDNSPSLSNEEEQKSLMRAGIRLNLLLKVR
jgi:hypothetical protein